MSRPPSSRATPRFSCSFSAPSHRWKLAQHRVDELASRLEEALDAHLFASSDEKLEQIVLYYLELKQETLAVAESCTGGLLSQRITSISGSSRSFLGGAVVYSNELKTDFAGVPPELIEAHGAVSAEVAEAMALGIRRRVGSTMGVGSQASPAPAAARKPNQSASSTSL